MLSKNVFRIEWNTDNDIPVGGSYEWLDVIAGNKQFRVPSNLVEVAGIPDVYNVIKSLVPPNTWEELYQRREQYVANFLKHNR